MGIVDVFKLFCWKTQRQMRMSQHFLPTRPRYKIIWGIPGLPRKKRTSIQERQTRMYDVIVSIM